MARPIIHGKAFLEWLTTQGIVPEQTRRVVIDASVDSAVMIYTEQYGVEGLVNTTIPPEIKEGIVVELPLPKIVDEPNIILDDVIKQVIRNATVSGP